MNGTGDVQPQARARTGRRLFWLSFIAAAVAVLFGWSAAENASNLRTCELVAGALNSANAKIDIRRVTAASFTHVIRIDYDVMPPGFTRGWSRFVSCRFAASPNPPFTENLVSVETEAGPLPDSKFYLMRRFYLDTGEARNARIPFATNGAPGLANAAAHALEWFLSVLSKAAIYAVLAGLYLWFADLSGPHPVYRTLRGTRPDRQTSAGLWLRLAARFEHGLHFRTFCSVLAGPLAMAGALALTGAMSPLAIFLAILTGIACIACFHLIVEESRRLSMNRRDIAIVNWLVFSALIGLALFWFPDHGSLHMFRAPAWLFRPLPLFVLGNHGASTTAISALMVIAALLFLLAGIAGRGSRGDNGLNSVLRYAGLVAIPVLAGMVIASTFLQFGLALNPLLLCTKAALIALLVLTLTEHDRYFAVLPISLTVVTCEYALAPFMTTMATDTTSYMLLVLILLLLMNRRQALPSER